MKEYSIDELLEFVGEDDPFMNVNDKDQLDVDRFVYETGIVWAFKDGDPGTWTPDYYIYYAYCNWKKDGPPLSFKRFKRLIPRKCKTFRSPDGWEDMKIVRGNVRIGEDIIKAAKFNYVRSIVTEETKLKEYLNRKAAWRLRKKETRKKTQA